MWKCILAVWGSTATVIGIALYYTHDMRCLWFLLVPLFISFESKSSKSNEEREKEE